MNKQKQFKVAKAISIAVVTVLFLLSIVLIVQFVQINTLQNKQDQLQSQLETLENQIVNYSDQNDYLASDEFIEDYAREVLGFGLTGATRFR